MFITTTNNFLQTICQFALYQLFMNYLILFKKCKTIYFANKLVTFVTIK